MKKRISFLSALLVCSSLAAAPDEELFLAPHLNSELKNVSGHVVLDAGCGSASWAIAAAKNGAAVHGIDQEARRLDEAQIAIAQAGVERQVELKQGDVANLPYEAQKFDQALSVNVGSTLNRTMQVISNNQYAYTGLGAHFREIERVLKDGGKLVVAAPASYGVVFTNGKTSEQAVMQHIQEVLAKIGSSEDADVIMHHLKELDEVNRATFVRRGAQLVLVTDEKELRTGEPIWRKVPEGAVSNYYHSEEEYLVALHNAGLQCEEIKRPCFFGNVKYKAYRAHNDELGQAYVENHPFTIYYVTKRG